MNDPFIIKVRKLSRLINEITEKDIHELDELELILVADVEKTIKANPDIGRSQLISTLNEMLDEYKFVNAKVHNRVEKLQGIGMDDYDAKLYDTKELLAACDNAIGRLLQLLYDYFPKLALKNKDLYKEFNRHLLKKVELIKEENSRSGPKPTVYKDWKEFAEENKIKTIEKVIKIFKDDNPSLAQKDNTPVSIYSVLKTRNYIKSGKTYPIKAVVIFIGKECDIDLKDSNLHRNHTRIKGKNQGTASVFSSILDKELTNT